jgi:hypothetical protein
LSPWPRKTESSPSNKEIGSSAIAGNKTDKGENFYFISKIRKQADGNKKIQTDITRQKISDVFRLCGNYQRQSGKTLVEAFKKDWGAEQ